MSVSAINLTYGLIDTFVIENHNLTTDQCGKIVTQQDRLYHLNNHHAIYSVIEKWDFSTTTANYQYNFSFPILDYDANYQTPRIILYNNAEARQ